MARAGRRRSDLSAPSGGEQFETEGIRQVELDVFADPREPGSSRGDGWRANSSRRRFAPPREPCRRRARIDSSHVPQMLPEIIHDVNQRVADRAGRREGTSVISVSPHAASPAECAIDGACDADRETAEPARERPRRIRLGDEMDVVVLDRELNNPEIRARGDGKGAAYMREDTRSSQAMNCLHGAQRNVDGLSGDMQRARPMRNAGPAAGCELPSGTGTSTAPGVRGGQEQLNGTTSHAALIRRYYHSSSPTSSPPRSRHRMM